MVLSMQLGLRFVIGVVLALAVLVVALVAAVKALQDLWCDPPTLRAERELLPAARSALGLLPGAFVLELLGANLLFPEAAAALVRFVHSNLVVHWSIAAAGGTFLVLFGAAVLFRLYRRAAARSSLSEPDDASPVASSPPVRGQEDEEN